MKGLNLGIRLATLFSALYVLCGIVVYSIPGIGTAIFELLTHSTIQFTAQPFDAVSFALGFVAWAIICDCCKEQK